jgi:glycosyltransferase involved in cell wall biosynthesis
MGSFLHRLARALVERGLSVAVVAPGAPGAAPAEALDGVTIHRFPYAPEDAQTLAYTGEMHREALRRPLRLVAFLRAFRRAVRSQIQLLRPSIVHAHWWFPSGWVTFPAAGRAGVARVLSIHGTDLRLLRRVPIARPLARRVLARADLLLPVSAALDAQIERLGVPRSVRREILPMPADPQVFHPDEPREPSPRTDRPSFVIAARLTSQKRIDRALRAVALLRDEGTEVSLHVAGDGSEREALEALVRGLRLEPLVTFHGMLTAERLAELFRAATAVVLTSEAEGYGLSLAEGGLCGTAGIGVRSGGIEELVEAGVTGLLVEPDDDAALARALVRLARDPELAGQLGRAARNRALLGTPVPLASRLAALYAEVTGTAP